MNPQDYERLIDHDKLRAAEDRCEVAASRFATAITDFNEASRAHESAQVASDRAVNGHGDITPLEAEHALVASATALSAATKVRNAAGFALQKANEERPVIRALAHVPFYLEGIRQRVAAAQKADRALATLAQADREHEAGQALMRQAALNGVPHMQGITGEPRRLGTEVEERALWASVGIDAEREVHPWDPGLKGS